MEALFQSLLLLFSKKELETENASKNPSKSDLVIPDKGI
jgi:hypothetical protein